VLAEHVSDFFLLDRESPYMLLVAPVLEKWRTGVKENGEFGIDKLKIVRSTIPAVTHVDYSARVQTVHREDHQLYHEMIAAFREKTG
jgi:carbamoyltransferase